MKEAFIIDALRTPRGKRKGSLSGVHPVDLLTYPLNEICSRNNVSPQEIEDVAIGCVTQTGEQGWCVARSSVLAAGWPHSVPATTVNRLCGSGQQAVNNLAMAIKSGTMDVAIGGGLEHMTRCTMFSDIGGEESPLLRKHHPDLVQQGMAAEILSETYNLSRQELDEYAYHSQMKAKEALADGRFARSLVPVPFTDESGNSLKLSVDENPRPTTTIEGLATLKTVFKEDGVITAGNASAIVDGAAALLLSSEQGCQRLSLKPRARIVSMAAIGSPPRIMLTGPIAASRKALEMAGLKVSDIDLWEINEAFAPVPIITMRELEIDPKKVNVSGGGISLGHPLGATGAMLLGTALDELERSNKKFALITMCIGLGMGIATIIERS
jgi:acetyl-CoA C-acetyltransferase